MQKSIKIIQEKVVFAPSLDWNFPLQLMGVYAAKRNHFNLLKIQNLFVDLYFSLSLSLLLQLILIPEIDVMI